MASKATVKVGGKKTVVAAVKVEGKKEKKERVVFDLKTALDENGNAINLHENRLTALPTNVPEGTKGLKRNSFSTKVLYAQYQRELLVGQELRLSKRIEAKDSEIVLLKSGGDPRVKKLMRVKKLQAQIDALQKALAE